MVSKIVCFSEVVSKIHTNTGINICLGHPASALPIPGRRDNIAIPVWLSAPQCNSYQYGIPSTCVHVYRTHVEV